MHENFRLIVVAEDKEVERFPIPLVNRLEKHYLGMETMIGVGTELAHLVRDLKQWAIRASQLQIKAHEQRQQEQFGPQDVFIGYHEDVVASMVLRLRSKLGEDGSDDEAVKMTVKRLLLQCATPDAMSRLSETSLPVEEQQELYTAYHVEQDHSSLAAVLLGAEDGCKLIQVISFEAI